MKTTIRRVGAAAATCAGVLATGAGTAAAADSPDAGSVPASPGVGSTHQGAELGLVLGVLPKTPLTRIAPTGPTDPAGKLLAAGYPRSGALPPQVGNVPQLPLHNVVPDGLTYPIVNLDRPLVPIGSVELPAH